MKRTTPIVLAFACGFVMCWLIRDPGVKNEPDVPLPVASQPDEGPIAVSIREPGKKPVVLKVVRWGVIPQDNAESKEDHWRVLVTNKDFVTILFCEVSLDGR